MLEGRADGRRTCNEIASNVDFWTSDDRRANDGVCHGGVRACREREIWTLKGSIAGARARLLTVGTEIRPCARDSLAYDGGTHVPWLGQAGVVE